MGPRCNHIRENTRRPTKDIVLQFNAFVHRDIVLEPAAIPDPDIAANIHILPERTVPTDDSSPLDMAEMPNLGPFADGDPIVDIAALMNEKVLHSEQMFEKVTPPSFAQHSRGC
jgi:hypothetical protein